MSDEKLLEKKEVVNNTTVIQQVLPESMLEAIELDANVLQMSKDEEKLAKLWSAYSNFLGEVKHPAQTKTNPHFKSNYAPLDEVLNQVNPVLKKNGLAVIPSVFTSGDKLCVSIMMTHKEGAFVVFPPLKIKPDRTNAQGIGSTITYAKRYAISAVCGVASDSDDDGNEASGAGNKSPKAPNKKPADKPNQELKKVLDEIGKIAGEKAKIDKVAVGECVKKYGKVAKHTTIKDIKTANALLTAMKNLEVKETKEDK